MLLCSVILLVSLALRLYRLDHVPLDYDRSYPHGMGILLLDSLRDGTLGEVAFHGQPQSLGWPNPILANYIMAAISLVDRNALFAFFIIALSNVVVTALAIRLTRRLFGRSAALFAGLISATSPWAVFFARGTWQLGLFELTVALPACLLWFAVVQKRRWVAVTGLLTGALLMHIYTVGLGLALQLGAGLGLIMARRRQWWRLGIAGALVLTLSLGLYMAVLLKADPRFLTHPRIRLNYSTASAKSGLDRGWPVNTLALERSFNLISGSGFPEGAVGDIVHLDAIGASGLNVRVVLVTFAMLIGMMVSFNGALRRSSLPQALLVAWFWIPILFMTIVTTLSRSTPVSYYYLLLCAPAGTIVAGVGFTKMLGLLARRKVIRLLCAGICALIIIAPSLTAQQQLTDAQSSAVGAQDVLDLPLRELIPLRQAWETACAELTAPFNPFEDRLELQYWAYSWTGATTRVAPLTEINLGRAQTWAGSARRCALRLISQPAPPNAQVIATSTHATLYQPVAPIAATEQPGVMTSIGWQLDTTAMPSHLQTGKPQSVLFRWQMVAPPTENHATWRYDLFVKLLDANGKTLTQMDVAAIPGSAWQSGMHMEQTMVLDVPASTSRTGHIEISLYDRAQQKNALFVTEQHGNADAVIMTFPVTLGP